MRQKTDRCWPCGDHLRVFPGDAVYLVVRSGMQAQGWLIIFFVVAAVGAAAYFVTARKARAVASAPKRASNRPAREHAAVVAESDQKDESVDEAVPGISVADVAAQAERFSHSGLLASSDKSFLRFIFRQQMYGT